MKILVCAEEQLREEIKMALSEQFDLISVDSEEQCFEVIKNTEVGKVILDLSSESVIKTVEQLKADHPNIEVIVVGTLRAEGKAKEAVAAGASKYLLKPFKADELLGACR